MKLAGNVWKFGDDVSATDLFPARYDKLGMKRDWDACALHILEDLDPGFASSVRPGDIVVAGRNFGSGHAHYFGAAINGLRATGLGAAFASSINGLFFRAATDLGLISWTFPDLPEMVETGDEVQIDLETGLFQNDTQGVGAQLEPPPRLIAEIFRAGGTTSWAVQKVKRAEAVSS